MIMEKKLRFLAIFLTVYFAILSVNAQVGIGTTNPQQDLHIAGSDATIRFETLDATHSAGNNGVDLAPAFVQGKGDIVINNSLGGAGISPLNFLIENTNFIPDDPYNVGYNTGKVVNNPVGQSEVESYYRTITFTAPYSVMIEVKFGVTLMVQGADVSTGPPFTDLAYDQAITVGTFFCVDIDDDGLDATERSKEYGYNGMYYVSGSGGLTGYAYLNGQAYLVVPAGDHRIYFFGSVSDSTLNYTSAGFGGAKDYLKIRVYN